MAEQEPPSPGGISAPEPEESAARFHETVSRAHKRRLSAAIMRQLWQENHFVDGFLAEMGVNRGTSR